MAQRRMFSLEIVDTDLFLDMPASTQNLYFHLGMRADDDGFVSSPKKITVLVNCSSDDLKLLIAKSLIIPFDSGVCVVRDWKINNYIQRDRYKETRYLAEKSTLEIATTGSYSLMDTECVHDVSKLDIQVRLGKSSKELDLDKESKEKNAHTRTGDIFTGRSFSPQMQDKLTEWLKYKSERRESYKPTGLKSFLSEVENKLKTHVEDEIIDLIGVCMGNNWRGIIWDKLKPKTSPTPPSDPPRKLLYSEQV